MQKYLSYSSKVLLSFTKECPMSPFSPVPLYQLLDLYFPDIASLIFNPVSDPLSNYCFFQYLLLLSNLSQLFL